MNETSVLSPTLCYHCGNDCEDHPLQIEEKSFCCEGCKTVYELLSEHQLCKYYSLDDQGKAIGISPSLSRFEFLEHPEVGNSIVDFQNDTIVKVTFYTPAIHCSSCLYLLEHLPRLHPAIVNSRVNFLKKQVSVSYRKNENLDLRQLAELLTSIGYEPMISLQDVVKEQRKPEGLQLLSRIGVAGFCAGNIMLFSFPEYLGLDDPQYKILFGWLSLVLSIPVVFYSGWGYFESVYRSLRAGRLNLDFPILLGILVAWTRSGYEVVFLQQNGYFDSLTGLTFFLLAGKWFQQKTYSFLSFERDYKSYFPLTATVVNPGSQEKADTLVPVQKLTKGDRIRIRNGELIPADGILYRGKGLIDYSFVTGESLPEPHQAGALVYAGGRQTGDSIEIEVLKNVSQSILTQLWNHDSFTKGHRSNLKTFADQVGKYFTICVLILASLTAAYWAFTDASKILNAFTAVLIIACPCALALSYPFALGHGLRMLGLRKFYLKNGEVIEQMAQCDTIVFDKTGTLTTTSETPVSFVGKTLTAQEIQWIGSLTGHSTHPLSVKIAHFLNQPVTEVESFESVSGQGMRGVFDGHVVKIGSAGWVDTETPHTEGSVVHVSINHQYLGHFLIHSAYREGLDSFLSQLKGKYDLYLLSGDSDTEKTTLSSWFSEDQMQFRMKPEDKLAFIEMLQFHGKKVLMLGDGLNDAGALKQAEVGIALSENTMQFSPASDGILEASKLRQLPAFLQFSHTSLWVIRFSFLISLIYNFIGLSYGLTGNLSPIVAAILMPVSSATMVLIATIGTKLASKNYLSPAV